MAVFGEKKEKLRKGHQGRGQKGTSTSGEKPLYHFTGPTQEKKHLVKMVAGRKRLYKKKNLQRQ